MMYGTKMPDQLTGMPEEFPFVFSSAYARFLERRGEGIVRVMETVVKGNKVWLPLKVKKNPLMYWGQFLYPPLNENGSFLEQEEEKVVLQDVLAFLREENKIARLIQPPNFAIFQNAPEGSRSAPFGTYRVGLEGRSTEELFQGLHGKHRNVIRNAQKKGAQVKHGREMIPVFYQLFRDTMDRNNMYAEPLDWFLDFFGALGDEQVFCGVAFDEAGEPLAGIFVPFTRFGAFYLHGGTAETVGLTGAMNLLHWRAIERFVERGVKMYDLVGARLSDVSGTRAEGIQRFKKRFGAELKEGVIWKSDLEPFRCRMLDFVNKSRGMLKGRMSLGDIIDQENQKLRRG